VKHYLKILEWLEPHAKRAHPLPADWVQALFDDLTENGRVITVVRLAPNASGPRIGLCGEKFFCEAGIDNTREDALFISRVDSAERLPETVPNRHPGQFALLGSGRPGTEVLDPVRSLFGDVPVSEPANSPPTRRVKPSTHLRRALADAPGAL